MEIYLATHEGVVVAEGEGKTWHEVRRGLNGRSATSIISREGVILAGTTKGIFCSQDNGRTWAEASTGLTIPYVRWMAYHPDISDFELAGTEPATIFVSRNGGQTWRECPEVSELRNKFAWWLPYSPGAGCVRGFAHHGSRAYAAVEVGGLLRSDDGGETWRLAEGSDGQPQFGTPAPGNVHPDVHSVVTHPASPDLIFAPTGEGFYTSANGGKNWVCRYECYVRAVWVDPTNPLYLILGAADGPEGENGRIETSADGGHTWQPTGMHWESNLVDRFTQVNNILFAVMANGELLATSLPDLNWQHILPTLPPIKAISVMV